MKGRALTWTAACALVVLGARALAYQLAPRPTVVGLSLEEAVGGPRLVVIAVVSLVGALALAASVAWLAAVAVRERHLVAGGPLPDRVRPLRILSSALLLFAASSLAFDALESYLHWHAGLGFHGLHCLVGPVHRDALPLLAALSIVAAAFVAAATHLVRWMRRTLRALVRRRVVSLPDLVLGPVSLERVELRHASERLRTRGPPVGRLIW